MSPAFYSANLKQLYHVFTSGSLRLVQNWQQQLQLQQKNKKANKEEQQYFDLEDLSVELKKCSLDMIGVAGFGFSFSNASTKNEEEHETKDDNNEEAIVRDFEMVLSEIERRSYDFISWPNWTYCNVLPRGRKFMKGVRNIQSLVDGIIQQRRRKMMIEETSLDASSTKDLLDLLLAAKDEETGEVLTDKQIQEEVMTFMFAGHETTSISLSWTLYLLAKHPKVEEKLMQEIDNVLGATRGIPHYDDLPKLEYLESVLQESMRLFPPQPAFVRKALKDNHIGDVYIPGGTEVSVVPYLIHRDEHYWPEPLLFDPDRFCKENKKGRHSFSYLPFSGGLRSCIGKPFALMEAKVLLSVILYHFSITLESTAEVFAIPAVTLRPHGLRVQVHLRHKRGVKNSVLYKNQTSQQN
ncbi:Cytochrome P450 4V2, variant 2 [Balamuthia mandrillaris]